MPAARMGEQLLAPGRLSSYNSAGSGRFSLFVPSLPSLSLSLREVGMDVCGHPDWGPITFVAGRAGVVEARGESPAALALSTWSPRGFRGLLVCTDALQIGKGRFYCLFVFFVLILLFLITVSDVPMQVS